MFGDDDDNRIFKVVVNHEEQYSIWPRDRANPLGWRDEGTVGNKKECLAHIDEVWTDMRPLSLRIQMEKMQRDAGEKAQAAGEVRTSNEATGAAQ